MPATTGSQGTSASPSYAQASTVTPVKALPRVYVNTDKTGWPKDNQVRVYQALSLRFGKHSLQQVSWDNFTATFAIRCIPARIEAHLEPINAGPGVQVSRTHTPQGVQRPGHLSTAQCLNATRKHPPPPPHPPSLPPPATQPHTHSMRQP